MDDLERYGDYNEIDEPPRKSVTALVIKIVAAVVILAVVVLLGARLYIFNYYPKSMKRLIFTPTLSEYYSAKDGDISALEQKLLYPYDDEDEGNFFCSNLVVIRDIGELQVTLRYNESLAETLAESYGLSDFNPDDKEQFRFRLWRDGLTEGDAGHEVGELVAIEWESFAMYRYARLAFDGIEFGEENSADKIEWLRLEVFIDGVEKSEPFMILIYENHEDRSTFSEYELSRGEVPND